VNLNYYSRLGQVEYDFLLAPGADPKAIRFALEGVERARLDATGDLELIVGSGSVRLKKPVAYQEVAGERRAISAEFSLDTHHRVDFRLGAYDHSRLLVIDPVLVYSTFLGGSGSNEKGAAIAVDSSGSAYVTGYTISTNFPVANALDPSANGIGDAFVVKLNAAGNAFVFSTYLGGSGDDAGTGIAVDGAGNVFVSGYTGSSNFPTVNAAQSLQSGNQDAFITKLDPTGSSLLYSTYLGGSSSDSAARLAVDAAGNAYVTGYTQSTNFPTTPGAAQTVCGCSSFGVGDAFLTKLSAAGAIVYSTYIGGTSDDSGSGVAVDPAGNAYVVGLTSAPNFPVTPGAIQTTYGGNEDLFVVRVNSTGSAFLYSTYLGGSSFESAGDIVVDSRVNDFETLRSGV
jgi:hypothetical protein